MPNQFAAFQSKLGITPPKRTGTGYNYAPFVVAQGQQTPGQNLFEKVGTRKDAGASIYKNNRSQNTTRLAQDIIDKTPNTFQFDEFGSPQTSLTNFQNYFQNQLQGIDTRGKLDLQTAQAKNAWNQANQMQNIGSYGFSGFSGDSVSGTAIPGASSNNPGAKAAAIAMQAAKNHTSYVWGGNSLSRGVDCSGLVQQAYGQLGIAVPRTSQQQAKHGRQVSVRDIRPGDLVFYNNYGHVGIYVGNGKIVHAANSRLGVITSNLNNSNGSPLKVLRPY